MCSDSVFNLLKSVADASVLCKMFKKREDQDKSRLNSTIILNSGCHTLKDGKIIK